MARFLTMERAKILYKRDYLEPLNVLRRMNVSNKRIVLLSGGKLSVEDIRDYHSNQMNPKGVTVTEKILFRCLTTHINRKTERRGVSV